jgi:hypothetical protein
MAESKKDAQSTGEESKHPFVPKEDRPGVRIDLDTPLSELRVRELSAILGFLASKNPNFEVGKTPSKDFFDKPFPEVAKNWLKEAKNEKFEMKEFKEKEKEKEKPEKPEKPEKVEIKEAKPEKVEIKEAKAEKLENDAVFDPGVKPDPRIEQVIQAVAGLTRQVGQLVNELEELRKKVSG